MLNELAYGARFSGKDANLAFAKGSDIPAIYNYIPVKEVEEKLMPFLENLNGSNLTDIELFGSLNIEAAKIWEEILTCHIHFFGSEVENEVYTEQARLAYAQKGGFCPSNVEQEQVILESIKNFHQRVINFLMTSNVTDISVHLPSILLISDDKRLPVIHPLFTQILQEFLISHYYFFGVDKESSERQLIMGNLASFYDEKKTAVMEDVRRSEGFDTQSEKLKESADLQIVHGLFNTLNILKVVPLDCKFYGLWPASLLPLYSSTGVYSEGIIKFRQLLDSLEKSCGKPNVMGESFYIAFNNGLIDKKSFNRTLKVLAEKYRELYLFYSN